MLKIRKSAQGCHMQMSINIEGCRYFAIENEDFGKDSQVFEFLSKLKAKCCQSVNETVRQLTFQLSVFISSPEIMDKFK